jgi:hypothetical protein
MSYRSGTTRKGVDHQLLAHSFGSEHPLPVSLLSCDRAFNQKGSAVTWRVGNSRKIGHSGRSVGPAKGRFGKLSWRTRRSMAAVIYRAVHEIYNTRLVSRRPPAPLFIAVSFHRLFLGGLLPSRARFRFTPSPRQGRLGHFLFRPRECVRSE